MPKRRPRPGAVLKPRDNTHREKYPLQIAGVSAVNRSFPMSSDARRYYNQGESLQCVTFSTSQLMTILNGGRLYHPAWLFYRCQEIDGRPGERGTSCRAAFETLKNKGHVGWNAELAPLTDDPTLVPDITQGISEYRWISTDPDLALAQARACIAEGMPFVVAIEWYYSFAGNRYNNGTYIDPQGDWGNAKDMRHQILIDGAFDNGEYFTTPNSYGWAASQRLSYAAFKRLVVEGADAGVVTDYVPPAPPPPPVDKERDRGRRRRRLRRRRRRG